MSEIKAIVLYDYQPQNAGEIIINAKETVIITEPKNDLGWCKAINKDGNEGIIPACYIDIAAFSMNIRTESPPVTSFSDDDTNSTSTDDPTPPISQPPDIGSIEQNDLPPAKFNFIKMPKSFMKNGGENFILGRGRTNEDVEAKIEFVMDEGFEFYQWQPSSALTCEIKSHRIANKYRGLQTYVEYCIKSSCEESEIFRRYNQFDWLYQLLIDKFPCVVIPPLPGKQAIGKFEEQFILLRRKKLQKWLTCVTMHPILSQSFILKHFLTNNGKIKWHLGKRKSEKDTYQGANFFFTVDCPPNSISWDYYAQRIDKVLIFTERFNNNFRELQASFVVFNHFQNSDVCKEFTKISSAISALAKTISINPDNKRKDTELFLGLIKTGDSLDKIWKLFQSQSEGDNEFLNDNLEDVNCSYKEILTLIELGKCSVVTAKNGHRRASELKLSHDTAAVVDDNVQVVAKSVDAELTWLQDQREAKIRATVKQYLANQLEMYTKMATLIADALSDL